MATARTRPKPKSAAKPSARAKTKQGDAVRAKLEALLVEGRASLPASDAALAKRLDAVKLAPLARACATSITKAAGFWRNEKYTGTGRAGPIQAVLFSCPLLFPPGHLTDALGYGYAACQFTKRSKILGLTLDQYKLSKATFSDCGGFDVSALGEVQSDDDSTEFEDYRMVRIAQLVNLAMEQVSETAAWQGLERIKPFRVLVGSNDRWPIVAWEEA